MKSLSYQTKKQIGLNIQVLSSDAVINGNAIDLKGSSANEASIEVVLMTGAVTTGSIEIKDFQLSSVSDFSSDVTTVDETYAEHFIKGNVNEVATSALAQTVVENANSFKKIGLHSPISKRYFRVRFETKSSADLTAGALVSLKMLETPVNQ